MSLERRSRPEQTTLSTTERHRLLGNDRRRRVLEHLLRNDGQASLRPLSEAIAAGETDTVPPPRDARKSVYVSLHQTHLPALDDAGVVEYAPGDSTIRLQAVGSRLEPLLRLDEYLEAVVFATDCSVALLSLAVLGMLLSIAGVTPPALVSPTGWAFGGLASVGVLAAYQRSLCREVDDLP